MCTLALAWQTFPDDPVVAAANRDEAVDRPSGPPGVLDEAPLVVAPRDEAAGGTWIGYNEFGLFATITNRWLDDGPIGERSRGLLVRDALAHDSAEEASRFVERELAERSYEGFNLVLADGAAALLIEWDGSVSVRTLDPGVHVVTNVGADGAFTIPAHRSELGEQQAENAAGVHAALHPEPGEDAGSWLDRAAAVLADHEYGVCLHRDRFGTRSASLVRIDANGAATYWFADGPPCETAFDRVEPVGGPEDQL